jgi:hypothetical protein
MSKVSTSEMNSGDQKQVVEIIPKLQEYAVNYLIKGCSRKNLIQQIGKSFRKVSNQDLANRTRVEFMEKLVHRLKREKIWSVNNGRLFLFRLWEKLGANESQHQMLKSLPWYQKPSEYRLRMDEWRSGERKHKPTIELEERVIYPSSRVYGDEVNVKQVQDSPPRKKGTVSVLSQQLEESSGVHVASVVVVPTSSQLHQQEEIERRLREKIVQRMVMKSHGEGSSSMGSRESGMIEVQSVSKPSEDYFLGPLSKQYQEMEKARNQGSKRVSKQMNEQLYAIIDVEGVDPNLVEIAVMLCTREELRGVRLYHLKTADLKALNQGSKYCHGIDAKVLKEIATHHQDEALEEIKGWLESQVSIVVVLSADEQRESDVSKLVMGWKVKYVNVCLPRWKDRINSPAYRETQVNKENGVQVGKVSCPYKRLHRKELLVDRSRIQLRDGGHCALGDVIHLHRHLQLNNMWSMVERLAEHAVFPHSLVLC